MVRVPEPSRTAAERGEAELRILNFKTTWSEFQNPSQITAVEGKAELHLHNYFDIHVCPSLQRPAASRRPTSELALVHKTENGSFLNIFK